jgi:hypothetical protein
LINCGNRPLTFAPPRPFRAFFALKLFSENEDFFWHTSCDDNLVARKSHDQNVACAVPETAVQNLRKAVIQLAGLRVAPRVRKIPTMRRRLSVLMVPASPQSVNIRHTSQNLGTAVSESQPVQNQRA